MHALVDVDLEPARGRFTAIIGPSGSGESTLMRVLAGLDRPTAGTVHLDGVEITRPKEKEPTRLRREKLGFVFQSFSLLPTLTAYENIYEVIDGLESGMKGSQRCCTGPRDRASSASCAPR